MSHTVSEKADLLARVRRVRGQIDAVERLLEAEENPALVLQTIAACRGAMNGLMAKVLEGHVRHHVLDPEHRPSREQQAATEQLIEILKRYLK